MRSAILSAQALVDVSVEQARGWFLSLKECPGRYRFDTHGGFEFVQGGFGEVGARFRTRERFFGLSLCLLFELTEVGDSGFAFLLARPASIRVWGRFDVREEAGGRSQLSLQVGSETRLGQLMLWFFPVALAVGRQIHREVEHLKLSMEREFTSARQ